MELTVNGEARTISEAMSVAGLLAELGVDPEHVAIELNGDIVERDQFDAVDLAEGDVVEIVRFMAGG